MDVNECATCCYRGRNPCPRADYDPDGGCAGYVDMPGLEDIGPLEREHIRQTYLGLPRTGDKDLADMEAYINKYKSYAQPVNIGVGTYGYTRVGDAYRVDGIPVNVGVDLAQPGADKTVSWEYGSSTATASKCWRCTNYTHTPCACGIDAATGECAGFVEQPAIAGDAVAQESTSDEYLDDLIPANVDPEKNCTCVSCKHVVYGGGKTPRCRKFMSAINAQYALCTQVRFRTKYCGGKLFERSE